MINSLKPPGNLRDTVLANVRAGDKESVLARFSGGISLALNFLGTFCIIGLMVLINADVASRWVANAPIRGVPEIVGLTIVGIVFLQIANCLRSGRVIRSDGLLNILMKKAPCWGHALNALFHGLGAVLFSILTWASFPLLTNSWLYSYFLGVPGDFQIPVWPIKLVIVIGAAAMALEYLVIMIAEIRAAVLWNVKS